ncbi:uncharacterized protein [Arachis hypogaea]|uniref:uncharacterized protein isoform X2 n=1 Tax=Arachis hypogaea TaxID=3818 RepID=UPI000DED20E4|nr:uncharacterized protein LOC112797433 isoform X2 [Arachis hypogaea]
MGKPNKVHKVLIDPNEEKIECECSMWNSEGIPCSHIFCAMKYEGLEEIPPGLILRRWCKEAKDCRSTPVDSKDGPEGRLLRYGALCGAMSLVAQLGAEDATEFVVARDGIANVAEALQCRRLERVGMKLGLSPFPGIKDPLVSKTKGAPRKGKESEPASQGDRVPKRRRCTNCGVAGHTRRTCTWHRREGVEGFEGVGSPSYVEHGLHDSAAPSTTPQPRHCHRNEEGLQPENGNPRETPRAQSDRPSPSVAHVSSSPCCRNPVGPGGAGANIFLGG